MVNPPIIVFARPCSKGNMGAMARVMANFGLEELRIVEPENGFHPDRIENEVSFQDWALATKKGKEILEKHKSYKKIEEAIADCQMAIGSSGKNEEFPKGYARPYVSSGHAFNTVYSWQKSTEDNSFKWALIIGSEKDGLNKVESSFCQKIITIATAENAKSINAAMCLGMLLYHLQIFTPDKDFELAQDQGAFLAPESSIRAISYSEPNRNQFSTIEEKEKLINYVMESLAKTSFLKHPDHERFRARIRRWLQGQPIPVSELLFMFEIFYHLKCYGSGNFENRDFLKKR